MIKNNKKALIIGAAGIVGFCIIFYSVLTGSASGFDDAVRNFFYDIRSDFLTPGVKILTYLGNWQTVVILCLILLMVKQTRVIYGVPVSIGAIFVTILNKSIKNIVQRPRPDDVVHLINQGGFSFTSGHSITSMFVYGMLIYLVRTNVKNKTFTNILTVVLAVPMILIGPSRVYLGVHFPTDVLGGWCLGIAVIAVMAAALTNIKKRG